MVTLGPIVGFQANSAKFDEIVADVQNNVKYSIIFGTCIENQGRIEKLQDMVNDKDRFFVICEGKDKFSFIYFFSKFLTGELSRDIGDDEAYYVSVVDRSKDTNCRLSLCRLANNIEAQVQFILRKNKSFIDAGIESNWPEEDLGVAVICPVGDDDQSLQYSLIAAKIFVENGYTEQHPDHFEHSQGKFSIWTKNVKVLAPQDNLQTPATPLQQTPSSAHRATPATPQSPSENTPTPRKKLDFGEPDLIKPNMTIDDDGTVSAFPSTTTVQTPVQTPPAIMHVAAGAPPPPKRSSIMDDLKLEDLTKTLDQDALKKQIPSPQKLPQVTPRIPPSIVHKIEMKPLDPSKILLKTDLSKLLKKQTFCQRLWNWLRSIFCCKKG